MRAAPLFFAAASLLSREAAALSDSAPDTVADDLRPDVVNQHGVLEYDHGKHHYLVLPNLEGQFHVSTANRTSGAVQERNIVDVLLNRRQSCSAGYGYCASFGRCCPVGTDCCSYGYCIDSNDACCPNGPCDAGSTCCGSAHCRPIGSVCCFDGSHCPAGNQCFSDPDYAVAVCCTNSLCTAYVSDGVTTSLTRTTTRTTPPHTVTDIDYSFYYFTVTWTYYYYYWVYIQVTRSVVTSSITTDTTILSVSATDDAAATSSFSAFSATFSPPTPASATSLASLTSTSTTLLDAQTFGGNGGATPSATLSAHGNTNTNAASGSNAAGPPPAMLLTDSILGLWAVVAAVIGVLMVVL